MNDPKFATLLGWLRAKPALAGVRVDGDDKRIVRIVARSYATAERSILSMDPSQLEGLDGSGAVLRTWTVKDGVTAIAAAPASPPREQWPAGAQAELAQVIAMACDRATARHVELTRELGASYRLALDKVSALYEQQSSRLGELERAWYDEMRHRVQQAELVALEAQREADELRDAQHAQQPSTADGLVGELVTAVVAKQMTEGAKSNGAAEHKP